jgi:sigma-B regulation protein RsbU (phosphoserine phosphatase)
MSPRVRANFRDRGARIADFFDTYTKDLTAEDLQRLFTRDTRDAYRFFTRGVKTDAFKALPWHKRLLAEARVLFLAFTMKLSPARRAVYGVALVLAVIGLIALADVPAPFFRRGAMMLLAAFVLLNLLVLLEVADRLSLKNDLEVARQIQLAMLPASSFSAPGIETFGSSRPANTVGGDFYDIIPLDDGRLIVALGDVAGKGSPAALLMALLLAMLRTLVDENLAPADLVARLNVQVCRQAPGTRFITLFLAFFDPMTGDLTYVNAGHTRPLLIRKDRTSQRLTEGGVALGLFEQSTYQTGHATIQPDELMAMYSDGITEAENPNGRSFDESGLESVLIANLNGPLPSMGAAVVHAVEQHTADTRFADDLTILLLRRASVPAAVAV